MSDLVFEPMTAEDWTESGAGAQARKGEYGQILVSFADSGQRYARINTAKDSGGRFAGKKASSVSTALKSARDSKNAPEAIAQIEISGRGDTVYLENKAVEA